MIKKRRSLRARSQRPPTPQSARAKPPRETQVLPPMDEINPLFNEFDGDKGRNY